MNFYFCRSNQNKLAIDNYTHLACSSTIHIQIKRQGQNANFSREHKRMNTQISKDVLKWFRVGLLYSSDSWCFWLFSLLSMCLNIYMGKTITLEATTINSGSIPKISNLRGAWFRCVQNRIKFFAPVYKLWTSRVILSLSLLNIDTLSKLSNCNSCEISYLSRRK